MSQLPASGCWQHHTTTPGHLLYLLQTSSASTLACKNSSSRIISRSRFFCPYQNTSQRRGFSEEHSFFRCHSETWSGASPQATRVNRVWLTVPSHRPDHLGYMLMCSTGRERLEIQGRVADIQIVLATGKLIQIFDSHPSVERKPGITQRDDMHQKELVTRPDQTRIWIWYHRRYKS